MKRSQINLIIENAIGFLNSHQFLLPPFGYHKLDDWKKRPEQLDIIRSVGLGWDITDFGSGIFEKVGLTLFTIRNGTVNINDYHKPYAEKIMVGLVGQVTPMHYHASKMEDIINRGGGVLAIQVFNSDAHGGFADSVVQLEVDGVMREFNPGEWVKLHPGQSVTLTPYVCHTFHAQESPVLIGEVSMVNDDSNDNFFKEQVGRFPEVEEDVLPTHLLLGDYVKFL